jgi:hypothetical protein
MIAGTIAVTHELDGTLSKTEMISDLTQRLSVKV